MTAIVGAGNRLLYDTNKSARIFIHYNVFEDEVQTDRKLEDAKLCRFLKDWN